jgi:hypothetical protein
MFSRARLQHYRQDQKLARRKQSIALAGPALELADFLRHRSHAPATGLQLA